MSSQEQTQTCPECGQPLFSHHPHGLCAACLLAQALASQTITAGNAPATRPTPPPSPAEIASHFPQFEIAECLGHGGMGVVYKARQKSLDRWVAIKILSPARAGQGGFAERFVREARTLARLNHPNIVAVFDHGESGGLYYFVMEFVDGVHLRDLLRDGKLEPEQARAIVPPVCEALQYAHDQGIVHRDIKPENLLLDQQGRVKIADFGIAALVGAEGESIGTPAYMAPEQADRRVEVDHRADIYALGVVFYEMLTGERPQGTQVVAPSNRASVDARLDEIVLRALEKEPARRYQQASILKTQVETVVNSPVARTSPAPDRALLPPDEKAPAPIRPSRKRLMLTFAINGILLGSLAAGLLWYRGMALQADLKAYPLRAILTANTKVISPPPSKEARRLRALAALESAVREARHSVDGAGQISELIDLSGRLAQAGDLAAAFQTAESLDEEKYRDEGLRDISEAQILTGDLSGARQTIERIKNSGSKDLALETLAQSLAQTGDLPGAMQIAEGVDKKWGSGRDIIYGEIVEGLAQRGDVAAALRVTGQIEEKSRKESALMEVAVAQARAGNSAAAMQTLQSVHEADHKKSALRAIAEIQAKKSDYNAALQTIQGMAAKDDRDNALWSIISSPEAAGNVEGVQKVLAALQPLDPARKGVDKIILVCTHAWGGDEAGAVKILKSINDPKERERAWSNYASVQAARNDPIGAAKSLENAGPPDDDLLYTALTLPDYARAQYVTGRGGADEIIKILPAGRERVIAYKGFASRLLEDIGPKDE